MSLSPISDVTMAIMPKTFSELLGGHIASHYQEDCPFKNDQNNAFTQGTQPGSSFLRGVELPISAFKVNKVA